MTLAWATVIQTFKRLNLLYFLIKISSVGIRFLSFNKRKHLLPKLFNFAKNFRFSCLLLILHVKIRENAIFKKIFSDGKREKDTVIDVQCRQENPNPRQAWFPTGTVDSGVGIFLSPLNTVMILFISPRRSAGKVHV